MISAKYSPKDIEDKIYKFWLENGYFYSTPDSRKPYTIVIPPPNVTGVLHMGHMLNNTIQDVLIRRSRLLGYNACWVPGTDHASIATEAKVVAKLKEQGISKDDLTREEFLQHTWEWTHKHGGIILEQLKKLGCSCDWKRTKFTMDSDMSQSVIRAFVTLYNKGLIYKGYRMVHWDPQAKTTLSDEEVNYTEQKGHLYYIDYPISGTSERITIATTRPETIFADTAICINPNDERYQHLKAKKAVIPILNKEIPIIYDDYVDPTFGTGCLKVTPAHDTNDYALGKKHKLDMVSILNDDGTLNDNGLHYSSKDRFLVRKLIAKELREAGYLQKQEAYTNTVGTSERTGAVIEPKLSDQWFLKMDTLAKPALDAVLDKDVNFIPEKFINTYKHWMENIRDWNISRQLYWGHQIPVWYLKSDKTKFVVAETADEALQFIRNSCKSPSLTLLDLEQDKDVLDTWFSSWLWPMSVFNGVLEPNNKDYNYYYPTQDLVTAPEILFFWVARMVMAGYSFSNEKPFTNVYLTGIVRDKQRRKMSKSLGNSPDPLDLMALYGADGVRFGMLLSSPAGNDLLFDEEFCKQGSAFSNKLWNAYRLITSWQVAQIPQTQYASTALYWFGERLSECLSELEYHYKNYRVSDALMCTYKTIWDDFCSQLLEVIKPNYGSPIDQKTYDMVLVIFQDLLKILHPFMPFITEELWQNLKPRKASEALMVSEWPEIRPYNKAIIEDFKTASEIVTAVRALRKAHNIPSKETLPMYVIGADKHPKSLDSVILRLANLEGIIANPVGPTESLSFRVGSNEYYIPYKNKIEDAAELEKLKEELAYAEGFLNSVRTKLFNAKFMASAPEAVVAAEKKKEEDALTKIALLKARLGV